MADLPPMPAIVESISEAKAHFSSIVDAVGDGRTYVICRAGKPVAMLSPYVGAKGSSRIGLLKGQLSFNADWWTKDQAADAEIAASFAESRP
jgi:prevent-host-death family protein